MPQQRSAILLVYNNLSFRSHSYKTSDLWKIIWVPEPPWLWGLKKKTPKTQHVPSKNCMLGSDDPFPFWLKFGHFNGGKAHTHLGVSKNSGTPKSSILIGFSIINHPFWGTPIFGNTYFPGPTVEMFKTIFWPCHLSPGGGGGVCRLGQLWYNWTSDCWVFDGWPGESTRGRFGQVVCLTSCGWWTKIEVHEERLFRVYRGWITTQFYGDHVGLQ